MTATQPEQTSLDNSPGVCPHCHTTRRNLCQHDADASEGLIAISARRPAGCIAGPDPKTDPFPEGF